MTPNIYNNPFLLAPLQGATSSSRIPGVSLRSTPGYILSSLRDDKKRNHFRGAR